MLRRNWLALARKKVDRYDLDYSFNAVQAALGEAALSYWGEGVLATTIYPNPFPITMSNSTLGGTVGPGIAHDPNGQITRIDPASPTAKTFTILAPDAQNARFDLLVVRHKTTGDMMIPEPDAPLTTIPLNLHDDFELAVIPGTPAGLPVYPAKGSQDIILAGLRVPAGVGVGSMVTVDLGIRELASPDVVKLPKVKSEVPTGTIDGTNTNFGLSDVPLLGGLILVIDGRIVPPTDYTLTSQSVTMQYAPKLGQDLYAIFVAQSASSTNPIAIASEVPTGSVNGSNPTFTLAGRPASRDSLMVMVDGLLVSPAGWSLIQSPTASQIQFGVGYVPQPGQDVFAIFFVNPATSGSTQSGGGGGTGGSGALKAYGTLLVPIQVDPTVGILVGADQRQIVFVSSQSGQGQQVVTAGSQIQAGATIGQELILEGASDADYLVLNDGNGLALNGPISLTRKRIVNLVWDGDTWTETGRP